MKTRLIPAVVFAAFASGAAAQESKWVPYKFQGNERYEYKVLALDAKKGDRTVVYVLDIRDVGTATGGGEKEYDVSWTTKSRMKSKDLGSKTAFGAWSSFGIPPSWIVMNPMYSAFFRQLELKVGAEKNFFGAMLMKVTGERTVGGRKGFVCELTNPKKQETLAIWVIDPKLAMPIESHVFSKGKLTYKMELKSYKKD